MKLFYWESVEALRDYGEGKAFAFARTKEQAIQLVFNDAPERVRPALSRELERSEPAVFTKPAGFALFGSA